ncbi:PorP/SprF family type IX secretion system membrane protein [Chitinophaga horti]|uniref:PorP/SprF family type IX secretion system membrane protein n=1 Tax=Chitinophaga horti TaxID=2920382 RepID=A0ABY6J7W7_9BACT|nr:PorP/SprF family type IX secretion system membrane protein [Chitinophaga horti]UYQ95575.1 PorP/SprF family type IX secretion system membrane protein [Chitinophaga horti]
MKKIFYILLLMAGIQQAKAQQWGNTSSQVDPLATQYFQNQYLGNPAMAGIDSGLHLSAAYRRQWEHQPGVPVTMAFTAEYATTKRVGVGLNVYNDKAGLLSNTRVALTYAYHLPLSAANTQHLHFGLSVGLRNERLDVKNLDGEVLDPSIGRYNRRDNYFDGDFGVAYTGYGITLQAALPNMVGYFRDENKGLANSSTFFLAGSYRIAIGTQFTAVEPKVCFRGVRDFDNVIDMGANLVFLNNAANVFGMYHTSKNYTVGAGYNVINRIGIQASYSSQTEGLSNYLSGNFTLGLRVGFLK